MPLVLTEGVFQGALTARTSTWHHRKDCGGAARLALDLISRSILEDDARAWRGSAPFDREP